MQVLSALTGMHFDSNPFENSNDSSQQPSQESTQETVSNDNTQQENATEETNHNASDEESIKKKQALEEKQLGNEYYKKKDFQTAIEHYNKAIELDSLNMSLLTNRYRKER